MLRKTKIVCTLGPSTDQEGVMRNMIVSGMNVARFNFSHGSHEEHAARLAKLRALRDELCMPVAALLDTKGPEIRLKNFKNGKVTLKAGQTFTLTTRDVEGDENICSITYKELPQDLAPGARVLLDDGLVGMKVDAIQGDDIICTVQNGGPVSNHKGVNVPGTKLSMPYMSAQDRDDILFGIEQGFDFIAASFVRSADDAMQIRRLLESLGSNMGIIAKIENQEGVDNIDEILKVVDGVMVARGDLGVEIPMEDVPVVQKQIIAKCNAAGKPAVTATQMLESMITNYHATRAEASDVANAIYDGTDAIMLSGETASGAYPVEAVETMSRIAKRTEASLDYVNVFKHKGIGAQVQMTDAISHATVQIAQELDANVILSITESGYTARMVAKYRPHAMVVGVSPKEESLRRMALYWGVVPLKGLNKPNTDALIDLAVNEARNAGLVRKGDSVIVTAGKNVGKVGSTNLIQVVNVGEIVVKGQGIGRKSVTGEVARVEHLSDIDKIKEGSILVCSALENEMGAKAAQSAGIIAEEGGFTSPAAIVGINFGIPVIVGAAGAMKELEDGDVVTLDVESGTVYAGKINVK